MKKEVVLIDRVPMRLQNGIGSIGYVDMPETLSLHCFSVCFVNGERRFILRKRFIQLGYVK